MKGYGLAAITLSEQIWISSSENTPILVSSLTSKVRGAEEQERMARMEKM